ncbi:unnamed protein product [Citrullus colocynthis]|uniref:Uncharacterized protein n=1 Tax=Citrullus colocynthis TaxID=252529 RepID=A0ABP0YJK3_9ROSI
MDGRCYRGATSRDGEGWGRLMTCTATRVNHVAQSPPSMVSNICHFFSSHQIETAFSLFFLSNRKCKQTPVTRYATIVRAVVMKRWRNGGRRAVAVTDVRGTEALSSWMQEHADDGHARSLSERNTLLRPWVCGKCFKIMEHFFVPIDVAWRTLLFRFVAKLKWSNAINGRRLKASRLQITLDISLM